MAHRSDPQFAVLRVLRVKGVCETEAVAAASGLSEDDATATLGSHLVDGLVQRREGRLPGWALTPFGRDADARLAAEEMKSAGAEPVVSAAYRRFVALNGELLSLCTDWQLRPGPDGAPVLNDHANPSHDEAVVARLLAVDAAVQPITAELGSALARFAAYSQRLATACARVATGEVDWVAKPMIDSYHSVWFELHEDLLATLGIERGSEPVIGAEAAS